MEQTNTIFHVPNNPEGKLFLAMARKYLNTDSYNLRQRGRTPNHKKLKKDKKGAGWVRTSVPLKYADNLGIYLLAKKQNGNGKFSLQTLGIETINLAEWYRKKYWEQPKAVTKIERDVLPLLTLALNELKKIGGEQQ